MQQKTDGRVVRLLSKRRAAEEPGIEQWLTLGEAWPGLAEKVAAMKWTGAQPIASWLVAQSLTLLYAALAVVFSLLGLMAQR